MAWIIFSTMVGSIHLVPIKDKWIECAEYFLSALYTHGKSQAICQHCAAKYIFFKFISYLGMKSWDLHVCDRASTITHVDRVKKSNPWYNKIWLCLKVIIWSSQICLSVIFIHFVIISKHLRKLHSFTLFSITWHCFSLFLVGSKSMLALLPFKATITPRHLNDKCFHRADGDLICRFVYLRITFPMYSWCATRNPVPDSTYHLADLKSVTTESRNLSPCMTATPWSRVNWKMCDENSTFGCFDAICTQSSVTWPHCGTVHDFFGSFHWPRLPSWIGFFSEMAVTARASGACTQFKTKHQSKHQRVLPAYMALHKIAGYKWFW